MSAWTERDVPSLDGKIALVTGANTGIGFAVAQRLAYHGADVVLACRNDEKARDAAARIQEAVPGASVSTHQLDLSSLAAVHDSAKRLHDQYEHLDLLVNNAGGFRRYHSVTDDGLEATIAVNHFGPFAFTGLVLDLLTSRPGSRVVTVGSNGHQAGKIDLASMRPDVSTVPDRRYSWIASYCQAKLANLLFFYALDRRLRAAGVPTISVAGHPGLARTEGGREMNVVIRAAFSPRLSALTGWIMQSSAQGALSLVRAASDPTLGGGDYVGPSGYRQNVGPIRAAVSSEQSRDVVLQEQLWDVSEEWTGVRYPTSS